MDFKGIENSKELEWVFFCDAKISECVAKDGGVRFCRGEDDAEHIVDLGSVFWCCHSDFFGGDNVEDLISCLEAV